MDPVARQVPDGRGGTTTVFDPVTVFVYVVSLKPNAAQTVTRVGPITSPRGRISYTPTQCEVFELWALRTDNPAEIATFNWKFRSRQILGHPSFSEVDFDPLFGR
jgi:hypothetical protein